MKPTRDTIYSILTSSVAANSAHASWTLAKVDAIMEVIDRHWKEGIAERERGRLALAAFRQFGWHRSTCPRATHGGLCDCGYSAALESLNTVDADLPSVDEVVGVLSEARLADDVEQFNELQRARRKAFAEALEMVGEIYGGEPAKRAAERYPLRKRVPRVIPDPHGLGKWRVRLNPLEEDVDRQHFQILAGNLDWHDANTGVYWSAARVRALAALLDDPWTYEESTEVEEASDA